MDLLLSALLKDTYTLENVAALCRNVSQDISELEITCFMGDKFMLFTSSVKTLALF